MSYICYLLEHHITYSECLNMSIKELTILYEYISKQDTTRYNENQATYYMQASYIAQAVWGKLPKQPYYIHDNEEKDNGDKLKAWARALKREV